MQLESHHLSFRWVPRLALLALIVVAGTLAACQPPNEPTLPPATEVVTVAEQATNTAEPTATATDVPPSPEPTAEPVQRQATTLTILHTNDVAGETDPCG
jgi:hypothetical protein